MPNKSIPIIGDANWGTPLNAHLAQLQNPDNGGINSFEQFSGRPTTLTLDDIGKTYIYTQTGNLHQWTGTTWKVLNESVINVKDYGAVGDNLGKTPTDLGMDISNEIWNNWPSFIKTNNLGDEHEYYNLNIKPFLNSDTWDIIGIQLAIWVAEGVKNIILAPTIETIVSFDRNRLEVYIPAGHYRVSKEIRISASGKCTINGAGYQSTYIKINDVNTHPNTGGYACKSVFYYFRHNGSACILSNLNISGEIRFPNKITPLVNSDNYIAGIVGLNLYSNYFNNVWITNCDIGFYLRDGSGDTFIDGCVFEYCGTSICSDGANYPRTTINKNTLSITKTEIYSSWSGNVSANGVVINNTSQCTITNCNIGQFYGTAIECDTNTTISSCVFTNISGVGVSNTNGKLSLLGNTFLISKPTIGPIIILAGSGSIINTNQFLGIVSIQRPASEGYIYLTTTATQPVSPAFCNISNNIFDIDPMDKVIKDVWSGNLNLASKKCIISGNILPRSSSNKI